MATIPIPLICFIILVLGVISSFSVAKKQICSTILFKTVKESEMPLVQIEGVYNIMADDHDDFPIYKSEKSGLYFYYNYDATRKIKMFAFGQQVGGIFGVIASASTNFDPKLWPVAGTVNDNDLFGDAIQDWLYYSPLQKTFKKVYSLDKIKAVCVENSIQCDSGTLYLNDTITSGSIVLNDPKKDYFAKLPGIYTSIRPVYKHNRQNLYLHYKDGYWRVGKSYRSVTNEIMRVEDHAIKPEYVTSVWKVWTGTSWTAASGLKLLCRGVANGESRCQGVSSPCKNSGSCVYTKGNETVCICRKGSYGVYCQMTNLCPSPKVPPSSVSVIYAGRRPGEITTSFCAKGYRYQPMEFYVCEKGTSWVLESEASCQSHVPTPAPWTFLPRQPTTEQPVTPWDPSLAFLIFFGPSLAFNMIVPVFIWLGIFIAKLIRTVRSTPSGSSERFKAVANVSSDRYWLLFRVYSAFFNLIFWPWFAFVLVCAFSDLRNKHSNLLYCGMGMCGFCALFVAVEGYLCAQRASVRNIVTWDYILNMHAASPVIKIIIKRYKLKFYEVYHTDSYGYRYYEGTRTREVDKKIVSEPFVYASWTDESDKEVAFKRPFTRLKIQMDFKLADEATENAYKAQEQKLVERSKHLNVNYSLSRQDNLPNFQPYVLLCSDVHSAPWWMTEKYFWVATLLQFSWIYRVYFNYQTGFIEYVLSKKVFYKTVESTSQTGFQQVNEVDENNHAGPSSSRNSPLPENRPLIEFASQGNNKENYMSI